MGEVVCAHDAFAVGADLVRTDLSSDEIVCQGRRSARRVWDNVGFVPNPPGGFHNLEGAPVLAHPTITTHNERKESSMNTTTNLRKGSWIQPNKHRAARTAMLLLLLLLTLPA